MLKLLSIAFIFIIFNSNGFAQNAKLNSTLDTNKIKVGDQTKLKYLLDLDQNINVVFPNFTDTLTKNIEVISKSKIDTIISPDGKMRTLTQSLLITCFDSGYYVIPPYDFLLIDKKKSDTIKLVSEAQLLSVTSVPVDTTLAIKDIKAPFSAPLSLKEVLPYIIIGILLAGLIVLFIYYFKKRKKKEPIFSLPLKPTIPAHIVALEQLEKLRSEKLWQNNKTKEYYIRLSEIIRVYLANRFGVDALEMTTDEILDALKNNDLSQSIMTDIKMVLTLADLVKFAKEQPLPAENDNALSKSIDFINKSIEIINNLNSNNVGVLNDNNKNDKV